MVEVGYNCGQRLPDGSYHQVIVSFLGPKSRANQYYGVSWRAVCVDKLRRLVQKSHPGVAAMGVLHTFHTSKLWPAHHEILMP